MKARFSRGYIRAFGVTVPICFNKQRALTCVPVSVGFDYHQDAVQVRVPNRRDGRWAIGPSQRCADERIVRPAIAGACAVGDAHEELGQDVYVRDAPSAGNYLQLRLAEFTARSLATSMVPARIRTIDAMPTKGAGKIVVCVNPWVMLS
jgi:hypothetical protein